MLLHGLVSNATDALKTGGILFTEANQFPCCLHARKWSSDLLAETVYEKLLHKV